MIHGNAPNAINFCNPLQSSANISLEAAVDALRQKHDMLCREIADYDAVLAQRDRIKAALDILDEKTGQKDVP